MRNLRISYILPDFGETAYSGGLYVIFEHCNRLKERGHNIRILNNIGKKSRYFNLNCNIERHNMDTSVVETDLPHIVVGTHWHTYFFINKMKNILKNNTKLCLLVQSNERFVVKEEEEPLVTKSMVGRYKDIVPIHKIAVSKYIQDILKQDYGEDSVYIKNGLEIKEVKPLLDKTDKIRIVARYDPSAFRGWDLTNRVLERISGSRDDIEIHLFEMKGKKPTRYKSFFHKALTGEMLLGLFRSCDIYMASSFCEGFSYPIIESMSQGCSVCCTDAGGNREFCVDGEAALMSPAGDEEGLYNNLTLLLNDRAVMNKLKIAALSKAKEFKWERAIDKLENFYSSLSMEKYDKSLIDRCAEPNFSDATKRKIFFIYNKDPFSKYKDWVKVDEVTQQLKDASFSTDTFLFIDRHTSRSVKGRLEMLMQSDVASFTWKAFYNKKIKIKLPIFNKLVFLVCCALKIFSGKVNPEKKQFVSIIFAEGQDSFLKGLCGLLKIPFYVLNFSDKNLSGYSFEVCTKEFSQKEEEYRKIVKETIGNLTRNLKKRVFTI